MKKSIIIQITLFNVLFVYGQVESRLFPNNDALSKISKVKNINPRLGIVFDYVALKASVPPFI